MFFSLNRWGVFCYDADTMAISKDEVKKLAELSRLDLTEVEVEKMQGEIDSILSYIDVIQRVSLSETDNPSPHLENRNVLREDGTPHEGGKFTEALLSQAPKRQGRFLKVKKILGSV